MDETTKMPMPDLSRNSIHPAAIEAVKQIVENDPWPGTPWINDAELIITKCYKDYKSPKQIQASFVGMRFIWRGSMLDTLLAIRTSLTQEKK